MYQYILIYFTGPIAGQPAEERGYLAADDEPGCRRHCLLGFHCTPGAPLRLPIK